MSSLKENAIIRLIKESFSLEFSGSIYINTKIVGHIHVGRGPTVDCHGLQHHENAQK